MRSAITFRTAPLCRSARISRPVEASRKNPALSRAACASSGRRSARTRAAYCAASPAIAASAAHSPGGEGEINPLSGDRIDQAGGVADDTPVRPRPARRRRRLPAPSDGIGHEYGSSRAPSAIRVWRIHAAVLARNVAAVDPASACAQIPMARWVGPRERPDVSRRIRDQLDDDLIAGDAVREVAGGDRQLVAPERPREPAPDQAVGAVGANQKAGANHPGGRLDPHTAGSSATSETRTAASVAPARHAAASSAASNAARLRRSAIEASGAYVEAVHRSERHDADRSPAVSTNRARSIGDAGRSRWPIASAQNASARPVMPPPHGFSRGCDGSKIVTRAPRRASVVRGPRAGGPGADDGDIGSRACFMAHRLVGSRASACIKDCQGLRP